MTDPVRVLLGPLTGHEWDASDLAGIATWYDDESEAGRAWVRAGMVATVDGAVALDGVSRGISPSVDRSVFRVLRAACDVILVGGGTAREENYGPWPVPDALRAARRERGQADAPVIAQVTSTDRIHVGRGLFDREAGIAPSAVVVTGSDDAAVHARLGATAGPDAVVIAARDKGGVDLAAALTQFVDRGWTRVLCEGGPRLLGSLVAAGLMDELCLTVSPMIGIADSPRIIGLDESATSTLTLHGLAVSGSVLLTRWRPDRSQPVV